MRRRARAAHRPAEDRGAALMLVLVIVSTVGLAGAGLLTFSDTSIRTTVLLRGRAATAYAADGAGQVAINSLSTGYGFASGALFDNATNTTCFGPDTKSGTLNLPDFFPAASGNGTAPGSASVACSADPATGVNGTVVPITAANRPAQAIMTLGQSTEDGINIKALSSNPFSVQGAVMSNSNINVKSGTLQSTAAVTAFGACTGSIISTPKPSCTTKTSLVDPGYASEATLSKPPNAVPAYQPVPSDVAQSCPKGVVTFNPGYYDDASALTALMTGKACGGSTWWFTPGIYYFDFHNNLLDTDVYRGSGTGKTSTADQWQITSGKLVAGTPADSNGNPLASPGASPTIPGSCQNPLKSANAPGVQFIFGGDSQLALGGSADAEICGTYHADRPPIGVYGLKSGAATTTTATGIAVGAGSSLKMSTVPVQPSKYVNPTNIIEQDGKSSVWTKTTATAQTMAIAVSGYAPPTAIPAGSIVKSATVRVTHGNSKGYLTGKDSLSATFTPKGVTGSPAATAIPLTTTLPTIPGLVTDSTDVYGGGTSAFDTYVHSNGFTGADMDYASTLIHAGDENLDSIQIDISYVTPAFRSEKVPTIASNCMTQTYAGTPGIGCAVISTSALSSFSGRFYVQGTVYTPKAAVDLTMDNDTQQALRFGVISRTLWVKQTASFSFTGPVLSVPDYTSGGNGAPIVFLTVFLCPATTTSSCSTDATAITSLRAKAMISGSKSPSPISILSWSNLR